MFKIKRNLDGSVARNKARLVAQGFSQIVGSNFHETVSLVAKADIVQMLLAVTMSKLWKIQQIDMNNAFLDVKLHEKVYTRQSPRFEVCDSKGNLLVCRLKKSLYGLGSTH